MKRPLLSILPTLSLLLCAAVVIAWVGSVASATDLPLWSYQVRTKSVYVSSTAFRAIEIAIVTNPIIKRDSGYFYLRRSPAILGIYFGPVANPNAARTFIMLFPYWLLFMITAAWPATSLWRRVAARRLREWKRRHRICLRCGYDLRATPDRCPECGAVLAGATT